MDRHYIFQLYNNTGYSSVQVEATRSRDTKPYRANETLWKNITGDVPQMVSTNFYSLRPA